MLTIKELRIIELYRKNPFSIYTIRAIMKQIKTKSYDWTYNAIKKLEKDHIINIEKIGQGKVCSINLNEQKTINYVSFLEENKALEKHIPNFKNILEIMPDYHHILIITGSYVDGTSKRDSDLDVVIIIENKEEKQWLLNKLLNKGELMIPKLHPYIFTREEFLQMLVNSEQNYGKEIEKKHLIIYGAEDYYRILKKAIKNGYKR